MANCPKCGRKLKLFDLKPTCPGCGVNLLYYKIEERLEVDAINAELEHAKTQQRIDRAKASMVGSALTIVRLVFLLATVGMLFLPLATMHIVAPYYNKDTTINVLEVYNKVSAMDFDGLFAMIGSKIMGTGFTFFAVAIVGIALAAVCALLGLILSFLSCSPHGFSRNVILSSLGIVGTVTSIVAYGKFIDNIEVVLPDLVSGSVGIGAYLTIVAFALVLAINIVAKVKGVNVKYKETYVDRVPYNTFVEKFGVKRYDMEALEAIKADMEQYKVTEE